MVAGADFQFLITTLVPEIKQSEQELHALLSSEGAPDELCVVTAKGVLDTLRFIYESLFRTSAARQRTASGDLIANSPTLREIKTFSLYKHPVFTSSAYEELVKQVRQREDDELAGDTTSSAASATDFLTPCASYRWRLCFAGKAFDIHTSPAMQRLINENAENYARQLRRQDEFNERFMHELQLIKRQGHVGMPPPAVGNRLDAATLPSSLPLITNGHDASADRNGVQSSSLRVAAPASISLQGATAAAPRMHTSSGCPSGSQTAPQCSTRDSNTPAKRARPASKTDADAAAPPQKRHKGVQLGLRGLLQHLTAYREGVSGGPPIKDLVRSKDFYACNHLNQLRNKLKVLHKAVNRRTDAGSNLEEALLGVARLLNPGTDTYKHVSVQNLVRAANDERKTIELCVLNRNSRDMLPLEYKQPSVPLTADQKKLFKDFCSKLYSRDESTRMEAHNRLRAHTPSFLSTDPGATAS